MVEDKVQAEGHNALKALFYLLVLTLMLTACGGPPPTGNQQPSPPTNVTAAPGPGYMTVTWEHDGQNVTGFEIWRDSLQSSSLNTLAAQKVGEVGAGARSFIDHDIDIDTAYRYSVVAKGPQGTSQPSAQVSSSRVEPGFSMSAGTYNLPGFAVTTSFLFLFHFLEEDVPEEGVEITITGPAGWNDDNTLSIIRRSERSWAIFLSSAAAVTGSYQASITLDETTYTAAATVDAGNLMNAPQPVTVSAATSNEVRGSWTSVSGARSYSALIREDPDGWISPTLASSVTRNTSITLTPDQPFPSGQYRLEVRAYGVDATSDVRPEMPGQFNASYARSSLFTIGGDTAPDGDYGVLISYQQP